MDIGIIITVFAMAVLVMAAIVFWPPVKALLKAKTTETDYNTILAIAGAGVEWAAQRLWDKTNEERYEAVLQYIADECERQGLKVSKDTMDKALEAMYYGVKNSKVATTQPPLETE